MKIINISILLGVMLMCVGVPQTSSAYFTTNQTATKLTKNAAVYTIEYAFGLEKQDVYMPVLTQRGLAWDSSEPKVGYTFVENEDNVLTQGTSIGMVVSKAPIVDGKYKLEKGKAQKLTLVVLLTTPEDAFENDYSLLVSSLPFYVDTGATELEKRELKPTELQYYVTKEVELNTGTYQ